MHKNDIINLLGIQEKLVKRVERTQNNINIYLESNSKLHICPSCHCYLKKFMITDFKKFNILKLDKLKVTYI